MPLLACRPVPIEHSLKAGHNLAALHDNEEIPIDAVPICFRGVFTARGEVAGAPVT